MLHHVPSARQQDRLLAEACRVLRPGGTFAGSDSVVTPLVRLVHVGDVMVPVDPAGLPARLQMAGFGQVATSVSTGRAFRFRASKPT
jgi:ubiquinone/menaquinone biosynthesis C-methylase UbiE